MLFQLHEWDIHALCFGTGGAKVTEVCSRVRVLPRPPSAEPPELPVTDVRGQPFAPAVCCLTADSRAGRESQPSCDQMI